MYSIGYKSQCWQIIGTNYMPSCELNIHISPWWWQTELTESQSDINRALQGRTLLGHPYPSWSVCPVSGCCIYGVLSPEGQFSGPDIAWVYPDSRTALLGERESHSFFPSLRPISGCWQDSQSTVVNIKPHRIYEGIFVGTFQDGRMIEVTSVIMFISNKG